MAGEIASFLGVLIDIGKNSIIRLCIALSAAY
jgi:hypothetical protein